MSMTKMTIDMQINTIDSRVSRLEHINDDWIASHGESNHGIYQLIQQLMDERDELVMQKQQLA